MYTILHNPRCSKSRQGLEILTNSGSIFEIREYLKNPLDKEELQRLCEQLQMKPIKFTRVKEKEFKIAGLTKESSDEEIINAMVKYPKLIERPILIKNNKSAVVGRPLENIEEMVREEV